MSQIRTFAVAEKYFRDPGGDVVCSVTRRLIRELCEEFIKDQIYKDGWIQDLQTRQPEVQKHSGNTWGEHVHRVLYKERGREIDLIYMS